MLGWRTVVTLPVKERPWSLARRCARVSGVLDRDDDDAIAALVEDVDEQHPPPGAEDEPEALPSAGEVGAEAREGVPQVAGWIDLGAIWSRPAAADVAVTLLTVAPYLAYLTSTEAGPAGATWGKRRVGLILDDPGGTATFGQVLVRNTVKVLPWQLGHMSAMRFAVTDAPTGFAVLLFVMSMVVLAAVVLPVLVGHTGLHDRVAGTSVRAASPTPAG